MSAQSRSIRARLLSGLDDAEAIETRPIDEVRTQFLEMGVDPEPSIRLAQKMAQGADADPAARLLQQVERAEDIDAEIAAFETAPIDDVRAALPAGIEVPSAAPVGRKVDKDSLSDGKRSAGRGRRSTLGWSGSLIGIAASALLFVIIRPDLREQAHVPVPPIEAEATAAADEESSEPVAEEPFLEAEERAVSLTDQLSRIQSAVPSEADDVERGGADTADDSVQAMAEAVNALSDRLEQALVAQAPPRPAARPTRTLVEAAPSALADQRVDASASNEVPPRPVPRPKDILNETEQTVALSDRSGEAPPRPAPRPERALQASESPAVARRSVMPSPAPATSAFVEVPAEPVPSDIPGLPRGIQAVLLVEEARAPSSLKTLADALPEGRLANRVEIAQRLAAGRPVIALITFARDDESVDAVLVDRATEAPLTRAVPVTGFTSFAESEPSPFEIPAAGFDLMELPAER